jgi:hypothetical protein
MRHLRAILHATVALPIAATLACTALPGQARAAGSPWWSLQATSAPTVVPRQGEAQLIVTATNLGNTQVNGSPAQPITFTDQLPAGITAVKVDPKASRGVPGSEGQFQPLSECTTPPTSIVSCKFTKPLPPYDRLVMRIIVEDNEPQSNAQNLVAVNGGETQTATLQKPLAVGEQPTPFGVESYELRPEMLGGARDSTAGSHPYQLTTTVNLNQTLGHYSKPSANEEGTYPTAPRLPRNLRFTLPPGLVGNVRAVPQCSDLQFATITAEDTVNLCPADSAIGVAVVSGHDPTPVGYEASNWAIPVFNLVPGDGEPARFGFEVEGVPVILRTAVPAGGDYAVQVTVNDVSQAVQILSSQVTLWGTPGDPSHDSARGWECLGDGFWYGGQPHQPCPTTSESEPKAFLTLPTSCASLPESTVAGESWPSGEAQAAALVGQTSYRFPSELTGCESLQFDPSLAIAPESQSASTPTGLDVNVDMAQPGLLASEGHAESSLKETTVALPQGMALNPAAANGLLACAALQFGSPFSGAAEERQTQNEAFSPGAAECPDAAKVGNVSIATPLLAKELTGSVYLAAEHTEPFTSPLVLYLVAEDKGSGIRVKLAGEVEPNPSTGQITTRFKNSPQLPFNALHVHIFGGERASLSTPPRCGGYTTQTSFVPWSAGSPASPTASFPITTGPGGGPCPSNPLPFSPSLQAGPTSTNAGSFSTFVVRIEHPEGQQALRGITIHLPPGVAAMLSSVSPCPEPSAGQEWQCGPQSLIGHTQSASGLGGEPVELPGQVYLTRGYDGAPFGLLVRTLAKAGPFNLGYVNVRSRIDVNATTAAVTVTTDPGPRGETIPTIIDGVPVQLKALEVGIDRPAFQFNPTNCSLQQIQATLTGAEGGTQPVSNAFQASNCSALPFAPNFSVSTQAHTSKAGGASLTVRISSTRGQANIAKTVLTLPKSLPARLTTLQKACLAATFETNPATCPEGSVIGYATVHTPVLTRPLIGPAYLVSHGGAAFPDVEFVLQGEGITLILDGQTQIKKGITTSSFNSVPDDPVESFEAVLPEGPHSALAAYGNLCTTKPTAPTTITGQNGASITHNIRLLVTGCAGVKGSKTRRLTRAQRLARALKACRRRYRHNRAKRIACERTALRAYRAHKAREHRRAHG